ncbi:MAG: hypothetical protein QM791_04845 [Ferruginibacter sp.]
MKKYFTIELTTTQMLASIVVLCWIVASMLVPLPPVNSLGM